MSRLFRILLMLSISIFFFQCQKDLSYIGGPDTGGSVVTAPDPINAIVQGNIVDENNLPASGVNITVGSKTVTTNSTGYFRVTDAALDKNTSLVTAEKAGYFKSYRVFSATSGTNQVVIKLIKRNLAGTIVSSTGGSATLANGAKITLPASSVVVAASGNAYSGDVKVFASYIDPAASDIAEAVPGSFAADDKNGNRVVLSSFGMLAVELESSTGERLQIKTGSVATLTSPIPSSVLSAAPSSMPLWYLDEQTGLWKEEGAATKEGNNYIGDVKHFSYWNCDLPYKGVILTATLHNAAGEPLVNVPVKVTMVGVSGSAHGYTDSLGQVKGPVPANKNLLFEITDPCGNAVYQQNLSPLTQNTDLGTITVTATSGSSLVTLRGTLLSCTGVRVKTGYAIISVNNRMRYAATNANGEFSTTFTTCTGNATTAKVIGVDESIQQQSTSNNITIVTPLTNAGNITACGTSSAQYINYTLDGTDYNLTSAVNDSLTIFSSSQNTTKTIYVNGNQKSNPANNVSFTVNNVTSVGVFPLQTLRVQNYNTVILTQPFNVTFTSYPNVGGEFYEGSLSGKFTVTGSATVHDISVTFRLRRS